MLGIADLLAYSEAKDDATCVAILDYLMQKNGISASLPGRFTKVITVPAVKVQGSLDLEDFPVVLTKIGWDADIQSKARFQYRNIYVSNDGITPLSFDIRPRRHDLGLGGSWCWFQHPRATYDATANKTWYNLLQFDRQTVAEVDHATGDVKFFDIHVDIESDDHNQGSSIVKASDRKLLIAYTNHTWGKWWTIQSSRSIDDGAWDIEDPANWDAPVEYDTNPVAPPSDVYTYCGIYQQTIPANDPIYVTYRTETGGLTSQGAGINQWGFSKSNDVALPNFNNFTSLYQGTDTNEHLPYLIGKKFKEDRIDFLVCTQHPDRVHNTGPFNAQPGTRMGHFFLDTTTDTPYKLTSGGPSALTLPVTAAQLDFITPTKGRYWCTDIVPDGSGNPWVLYEEMYCPENRTWVKGASRTGPHINQTLYSAGWDGVQWDVKKVARTGDGIETYTGDNMTYCGEACFDPEDVTIVYAGVEVSRIGTAIPGLNGNSRNYSVYELQKFELNGSWAKTDDVTKNSEPAGETSLSLATPQHNCRPFIVPGQPRNIRAWLAWYVFGKYESYAQHCTSIRVWPFEFDILVNQRITPNQDNVLYLHYGENAEYSRDAAGVWNDDYDMVALTTFAMDKKPGVFRNLLTNQTAAPANSYDDFKNVTPFGETAKVDAVHFRPNFIHSEGNAPNMRFWPRATIECILEFESVGVFTNTTNFQAGDGSDGASIQYYVQTDGYSPPRAVGLSIRTEGGGVRQYNDNVLVAALDTPQYHAGIFRGTEVAVQVDANVDTDSFTFAEIALMDADSTRDFLVCHSAVGRYGFQIVSKVERTNDWRETFRQSWIDANFYTKSVEYAG